MAYTTTFVTPVMEHWLEWEIAQWVQHEGSIRRSIAPWANALTTELHLAPLLCLRAQISPENHAAAFDAVTMEGAGRNSEVECSLMVRWVVRSILHGVDPLSFFSFQPVLQYCCNKGCGMCYPVCGMVDIKEPLLLIDNSSLCGGSGFPFSLSEWSLTICLTHINVDKMCWVRC